MLATVLTAALSGVDGRLIHVEADVTPGLPHTQLVGLPDAAVRESKERVRRIIKSSVPCRRSSLESAFVDMSIL